MITTIGENTTVWPSASPSVVPSSFRWLNRKYMPRPMITVGRIIGEITKA